MGTKLNSRAPALVEAWADASEKRGTSLAKIAEARECARAMREWQRPRATRGT